MSQTIDSKVVEMRFDNAQFEQNVATSLTTLDKLKQALKLDGSTKALDNVSVAAKNIDLSAIARGVDSLEKRFSTFGIVGMQVIQNLTNSAMSFAKNTLGGVWNTIMTKGKTRAFNIENARFQLQGLFGESKEGAAKVEEAMKNASDAVNGTAFGLDEAAKAASQFAASGVEVGEDMTNALLAISGTAAMTNSGFDDIARIFTTVAGNGRVMAEQLNQMSSRGLNAAAAITNYFNGVSDGSIEASDSIKESIKEITKGAQISEKELRDYVSKGLISFDLFATAMNKSFGEHAKNANNTVNGALSNVRAALGRIGAEFYSPLIKQKGPLVDLLNTLRVKVNDLKTVIEPVAKLVTDGLNRIFEAANKFINTIDIKGAFRPLDDALQGFVGRTEPIQKTIDKLVDLRNALSGLKEGDKIPSDLLSLMTQLGIGNVGSIKGTAGAVGEVASNLEDVRKIATEVISGKWGDDWATRTKKLTEAGISESTISKTKEYVNALWKVTDHTWNLTEAAYAEADAQVGVSSATSDVVVGAKEWAKQIDSLTDNQLRAEGYTREEIKNLREQARLINEGPVAQIDKMIENMVAGKSGIDLILESGKNALTGFMSILGAIGSAFTDVFSAPSALQIYSVLTSINEFSKKLIPTEKTLLKVKTAFKGLFDAIGIVGDALTGIGGAILPLFTQILGSVGKNLLKIASSFGKLISKLRVFLQKNNVFQKIGESISKFFGPYVDLATKALDKFGDIASKTLNKLATRLPMIGKAFTKFQNRLKNTRIYNNVAKSFENVRKKFSFFLEALDTDKVVNRFFSFFDKLESKLSKLWGALKNTPVFKWLSDTINWAWETFDGFISWLSGTAFGAFSKLGEDADGGLFGIIDWITNGLNNGFESLPALADKAQKKIGEFFTNLNLSEKIPAIFEKIKSTFSDLWKKWQQYPFFQKLTEWGNKVKDALKPVTDRFKSLYDQFKQTKVYKSVSKSLDGIKSKFKSFGEAVKNGEGIVWLVDRFKWLQSSVKSAWERLKENPVFQKISDGLIRVKDAALTWASRQIEKLPENLERMRSKISELWSTFKSSPVFEKLTEWGGKVKTAFSDLGDWFLDGLENGFNFAVLIEKLREKISDFFASISLDDIKQTAKNIGTTIKNAVVEFFGSLSLPDAISNLFKKDGEQGDGLGVQDAVENAAKEVDLTKAGKTLGQKAVEMFNAFVEGIKESFGIKDNAISNALSWVSEHLQNLTFKDIMNGVKIITAIKFVTNATSLIGNIKGFAKELKSLAKSYSLKNYADVLWAGAKSLALALGAMVVSIYILSTIPDADLSKALNAMWQITSMIGLIIVVKGIMKKLAGGGGGNAITNAITGPLDTLAEGLSKAAKRFATLAGVGMMFLGVGAGIYLLVKALQTLMTIPWGTAEVDHAIAALLAMCGGIVAVTVLLKRTKGEITVGMALTIIAIAAAINMLVPALKAIAKVAKENPTGLQQAVFSIGIMLVSLAGSMALMSAFGGKGKTSALAILAMAAAIGVLAIVVKSLAKMDLQSLAKGVGAIEALMFGLALSLRVVGKNVDAGTAGSILAMAAAMAALMLIVKMLGEMPLRTLLQGGIAVGLLLFALSKALKTVGKNVDKTSVAGIAIMTACVWGLSLIVQQLGSMSLGSLAKGVISVVVLLTALSKSVKNLGKDINAGTIVGIFSMVAAVAILMLVVKELAKLSGASLARSVLSVIGILISLGLAMKLIGKSGSLEGAASMIAMALAIRILAGALAKIGKLKFSQITKGLGAITLMMIELVVATRVMGDAGNVGNLLAMSLLVGVIGLVLYGLGQMPIDKALTSTLGLSAVLLALAGAMKILSMIDPTGTLFMMVALLGLAATIAIVLGVVSGLAHIPGISEFVAKGAALGKQIGEAIGGFIGGIVGGAGDAIADKLPTWGTKLSEFSTNAAPFFEAVGGMGGSLEDVKNLATAVLAITAADLISGITSFITGESDFSEFGTKLASLATGLAQYAETIAGSVFEEDGVADKIKASENLAQFYASLASQDMPKTGGLMQKIMGESMDIGDFGDKMVNLANGLAEYAKTISTSVFCETDVDDKITASENLAKFYASLAADELPKTGGLWQGIVGESMDLGEFGDKMAKLATGLAKYAKTIDTSVFCRQGIDDKIKASENLAKFYASLASESLPKTGGLWQWATGTSMDLGTFGEQLKTLATGLAGYAETIAGSVFETNDITSKIEASENLAQFYASLASETLPKGGGVLQFLTGSTISLETFGEDLPALATGLATYAETIAGSVFETDDIQTKIDASQNLASFYTSLAGDGLPTSGGLISLFFGGEPMELGDFGSQLEKLADGLSAYAKKISTTDFNLIKVAASTFLVMMLGTLAEELPTDKGILGYILGGGSGLSTFAGDMEKLGEGLSKFADQVKDIKKEDVQGALDTADALSALQDAILGKTGKDGGLLGVFDGTNLGDFSSGIEQLGTAINTFYTQISGVETGDIVDLISALGAIAELFNANDDSEVRFDMKGFKTFCQDLNELPAIDLTDFFDTLESSFEQAEPPVNALLTLVSTSITDHSAEIVSATETMMTDLVTAIQTKDGDLKKAAIGDAEAIAEGFKSKDSDITEGVASIVRQCIGTIRKHREAFKSAGSYLAGGLSAGMGSVKTSSLTTAISSAVSTIKNNYWSSMYSAGYYLMGGLAQGISSGQSRVINAIRTVATNAIAEAMRQFAVNSPSKVFMGIGSSVVEGLVKGIDDNAKYAEASSAGMARTAINGFTDAISTVSTLIDSGMDFTPTIRPVLDLTEIQNGVNQANSMFGERTMRLANVVADDMSVRNETSIGDSITDAVKSAIGDAMAMTQEQGDLEPYVIEVPVNIDGREVARVTAPFTRSELTRIDVHANRKVGIVGV